MLVQGGGKHASTQEGQGQDMGERRRLPLFRGESAGRGWKPSACWLLGYKASVPQPAAFPGLLWTSSSGTGPDGYETCALSQVERQSAT